MEEEKTNLTPIEAAKRIVFLVLQKTISGELQWEKVEPNRLHKEPHSEYALRAGLVVYTCTDKNFPFSLSMSRPEETDVRITIHLTPVFFVKESSDIWKFYLKNPLQALYDAIASGSKEVPIDIFGALRKLEPQVEDDVV